MVIKDKEFGEVIVRKNALSRGVKFSVSTSGRLMMSVPKYTSDFLAKRFLNSNRDVIRKKLPLKNPNEQRARDYQKKIMMKKAKEYKKMFVLHQTLKKKYIMYMTVISY